MVQHKRYQEAASHALAGFQLIEAGLKDYIHVYHKVVRGLLPDDIAYKHARRDVEGAALGKLINVFAKLNANDALVDALRKQVALRDELAHRAFLILYGGDDEPEDLSLQIDKLIEVAHQIVGLLDAIHIECNKLHATFESAGK